ncbi:MAG: hypothetical protein M1829_003156 [Trizodia sp. TS-e1964]|nr:MAG: hypothetical protein M1829_003156 [Trizodia sp. TS-e1964]
MSTRQKSTIIDFLSILSDVFAKEPPVISNQPNTEQQIAPPPPVPPPVPPLPPELNQPKILSGVEALQNRNAPQPPPRPPKPQEISRDQPVSERISFPPKRYSVPPPLPAKPVNDYQPAMPPYQSSPAPASNRLSNHPFQSQNSLRNSAIVETPRPSSMAAYTQRFSPMVQSPVSPVSPAIHHNQYPLSQIPAPRQDYQYAQPLPNAAPYQNSEQDHQYHMNQQPQPQPPPPKPRPPPEDLLSSLPLPISDLDTPHQPPPIPPNPERDRMLHAISEALNERLNTQLSQAKSSLPSLASQSDALRKSQEALENESRSLEQLDAFLSTNERILKEAMAEADRLIMTWKDRAVPSVDEVLVAPTVVAAQLYEAVAEERASADALFALRRGLDNGRIGLDVFLKQTRSLAREQFLKKALIRKISHGMGLEG